jgi:hypothetical protein
MFWHTATSSLLKATTAKVITAAAAAVAVAGGAVYATTANGSREPEKAAVAPNAPANRMAQPPLEAPASDDPGASDGATSGPATEATTAPAQPPAAGTTTKAAPRAGTTTKKTTKAPPTTTKAPAQAPPAPAQAPDTEAPSRPTNLVGTNLGNNQFDSQVVLDWDPSTDNVGVVGYKVYALTSNHGWKLVGDVNDGSSDDTVTSDEAYASEEFRVTAYDAAGNESDPIQVHVEVPFAV